MERLTERVGKSVVVKGCKTIFAAVVRKDASLANAIVRLTEYEDTGIAPAEIAFQMASSFFISDYSRAWPQ